MYISMDLTKEREDSPRPPHPKPDLNKTQTCANYSLHILKRNKRVHSTKNHYLTTKVSLQFSNDRSQFPILFGIRTKGYNPVLLSYFIPL